MLPTLYRLEGGDFGVGLIVGNLASPTLVLGRYWRFVKEKSYSHTLISYPSCQQSANFVSC